MILYTHANPDTTTCLRMSCVRDFLCCRFSKATTANASKRIGSTGPVPECCTGTYPNGLSVHWTIATGMCIKMQCHNSMSRLPDCRYLPRSVGMRRISLHKSVSTKGDKMYLLVCECADLLKDLSAAAVLIPALRARLCGYTGLYRPIQSF